MAEFILDEIPAPIDHFYHEPDEVLSEQKEMQKIRNAANRSGINRVANLMRARKGLEPLPMKEKNRGIIPTLAQMQSKQRQKEKSIAKARIAKEFTRAHPNGLIDHSPATAQLEIFRQQPKEGRMFESTGYKAHWDGNEPRPKITPGMAGKKLFVNSSGIITGGPSYYAKVTGQTVSLPLTQFQRKMTNALATYKNPSLPGPTTRKIMYKVGVWKSTKHQ